MLKSVGSFTSSDWSVKREWRFIVEYLLIQGDHPVACQRGEWKEVRWRYRTRTGDELVTSSSPDLVIVAPKFRLPSLLQEQWRKSVYVDTHREPVGLFSKLFSIVL